MKYNIIYTLGGIKQGSAVDRQLKTMWLLLLQTFAGGTTPFAPSGYAFIRALQTYVKLCTGRMQKTNEGSASIFSLEHDWAL